MSHEVRRVLLDANILIGAFDSELGSEIHAQASQRLQALLTDPQVRLAISPLIRYEVMRGVRHIAPEQMKAILNDFEEFDIRERDATFAAEVFRKAKAQDMQLNKRQFDLFHCVCAELNELEFESRDGDVPKIQKLIRQLVGQEPLDA